jgi:hypothetical protein
LAIAHNHPGGTTQPSFSDIQATKEMEKALNCLSITLVDHIIVARGKTISMAELKFISASRGNYRLNMEDNERENMGSKPSVRERLKSACESVMERPKSINRANKVENDLNTVKKKLAKSEGTEL